MDMVDAAPNAAVVHEPVAVEKTQRVTLEPVKDTSFAPAAGAAVVSIDAARDAACQAALAGLKADLAAASVVHAAETTARCAPP